MKHGHANERNDAIEQHSAVNQSSAIKRGRTAVLHSGIRHQSGNHL